MWCWDSFGPGWPSYTSEVCEMLCPGTRKLRDFFLTTWVVKILGWDVMHSMGVSLLGDVQGWAPHSAI